MEQYKQYVELIKEIDLLEAKKEVLRAEIEKDLPEEGFKDETINIFWTTKNKYTYSPKVKGLETELKETKKKEEEDGTATKEETKQLTIKVK